MVVSVGKAKKSKNTVDIRPQVPMYAAFSRLNYKPWFALAELVDNSVQSFLSYEKALGRAGTGYRLRIAIEVSDDSIRITDNAAGIDSKEIGRAFSPAAAPEDNTGLSEFGLGLKAAACWFAKRWSVRTSALGEPMERTVFFDVPEIVRTKRERLDILERTVAKDAHYTVVELSDLNVTLRTRALGKVREHLASIYRVFLREGRLELTVAGERLRYEEPPLLIAPAFSKPTGASSKSIEWRKDLDFKIGKKRVHGWAGLLNKASVGNAGFAVFRRGRLVLGSHGEAYRPELIFKKPNSYTYQRLVGELTVEGFSVSHTKDALQWDEEEILDVLKRELDKNPLPLLKQAESYRVNATADQSQSKEPVRGASKATLQHLPPMPPARVRSVDESPKRNGGESARTKGASVQLSMQYAQRKWKVNVQLVEDESRSDWYDVASDASDGASRVTTRINLAHPFMRSVSRYPHELQPLLRLVAALAVAEVTAREGGQSRAGVVRRNINEILRVGFTSK